MVRDLSMYLIGRANGEIGLDRDGGEIGRINRKLNSLLHWRWALTSGIIAVLMGIVGFLLEQYIVRHP